MERSAHQQSATSSRRWRQFQTDGGSRPTLRAGVGGLEEAEVDQVDVGVAVHVGSDASRPGVHARAAVSRALCEVFVIAKVDVGIRVEVTAGWLWNHTVTNVIPAVLVGEEPGRTLPRDTRVVGGKSIDGRSPKGQPGTIDRRILKSLAERTLGFDPTALLPEDMTHVEYTRLGVRLILNRGRLRVQGTHGPDNRTILTINLFGRDFGVVKQPNKTFPVGDLLSTLRKQIEDYDTDRLREWWQTRRPTPDE